MPSNQTELPTTLSEEQDRALVSHWNDNVQNALGHWEEDFQRIKRNMNFVAGYQYPGQTNLEDDRYRVNIVQSQIAQKVATLYAKNPTIQVARRRRLDFRLWDGSLKSLNEAIALATQLQMQGLPFPPELEAFLADVQAGRAQQKLVTRVAETLECVLQYFIDEAKPDFKSQFKRAVKRTCICGVSYAKVMLVTSGESQVSSIDYGTDSLALMGRIRNLVNEIKDQDMDETSYHFAQLRSLIASLGAINTFAVDEELEIPERLEFDFPSATSVVLDPRCTSIKDFIGARWVAQRYCLPVCEINAIFGTDIEVGSGTGYAKEAGQEVVLAYDQNGHFNPAKDKLVWLYEIHNKLSRNRCFIVDGWKDYVRAPEPDIIAVRGFWQLFGLTFNDTEVETEEVKDVENLASPYPQSDVELSIHPQREWNRSREDFRQHRRANAPRWIAIANVLEDDDVKKIQGALPHEVVKIKIPTDVDINKVLAALQAAPIDPQVYATQHVEQDLMLGGGMQQANIGPAQPNVTATVGNIAEQSRLNVSGSNIDDVDTLLTSLLGAGGEMALKGLSQETVRLIVGEGAVWPEAVEDRKRFCLELVASIKAASSGRPNKAVDLQNFQAMAPILLQSGANPAFVAEEGAKRLDDDVDLESLYPMSLPQAMGPSQPAPTGEPTRDQSTSESGNDTKVQNQPEDPSSNRLPPPRVPVASS